MIGTEGRQSILRRQVLLEGISKIDAHCLIVRSLTFKATLATVGRRYWPYYKAKLIFFILEIELHPLFKRYSRRTVLVC